MNSSPSRAAKSLFGKSHHSIICTKGIQLWTKYSLRTFSAKFKKKKSLWVHFRLKNCSFRNADENCSKRESPRLMRRRREAAGEFETIKLEIGCILRPFSGQIIHSNFHPLSFLISPGHPRKLQKCRNVANAKKRKAWSRKRGRGPHFNRRFHFLGACITIRTRRSKASIQSLPLWSYPCMYMFTGKCRVSRRKLEWRGLSLFQGLYSTGLDTGAFTFARHTYDNAS